MLVIKSIEKNPEPADKPSFFEFLAETIWGLNRMIDIFNLKIDDLVCEGLLKLLNHQDPLVLIPALHALCKTSLESINQMRALSGCQVLQQIGLLLIDPEKEIRIEALNILTKVTAGDKIHRRAVVDANLLPNVIENLEKGDDEAKKAAAFIISNTTFGIDIEYIKQLIQYDAIRPFCALLKNNDTKDMQVNNVNFH